MSLAEPNLSIMQRGSAHYDEQCVPIDFELRSLIGAQRVSIARNCAAYQGGCRVADIDLDQAREVDTRDGRFVWIGLHEPDQALLYTVQQRFGLIALANKLARIARSVLAHGRNFEVRKIDEAAAQSV